MNRHDRWKVLVYALASAAAFWMIVNPPWKLDREAKPIAEWLAQKLRVSGGGRAVVDWLVPECVKLRARRTRYHECELGIRPIRFLH